MNVRFFIKEKSLKNVKCANCGEEISQQAPTCPKCGHPNKASKNLSGKQIAVYLVVGIGVIWWLASNDTNSITENKAVANQEITKQEIDALPNVTASAMASAYSDNTVAADQQFKDKKFKVTGTVADINTDIMGNPYITLRGGVNQFMEPQFAFDKSDAAKLANLKKGSKVSLICIGKGDVAKTPMSGSCALL